MTETPRPSEARATTMVWSVPDAYIPRPSDAPETSHESVCVLNAADRDAEIVLEAYFEDLPFERSAPVRIPAQSCLHLRTDDPDRIGGLRVPSGVPYGLVIQGEAWLRVQYSRLDTTRSAYALMSVIPAAEATDD